MSRHARTTAALVATVTATAVATAPTTAANAAATTTTAAARDRSQLLLETPPRPGTDPFTVILLDRNRDDAPLRAAVTVTVTPKGGHAHPAATHRTGRNGHATFGLSKGFAGRVTVAYAGDRTHRPATATVTVAGPPGPPVFVLPSSYSFGQVLGCKQLPNDEDFDVTYTVVAHGGRYTDLGSYDGQTDTVVDGVDHAFTVQSDDGSITVTGVMPLPPGPQSYTFTPAYDEVLAPLTGDLFTKDGETKAVAGTFADVTAACP